MLSKNIKMIIFTLQLVIFISIYINWGSWSNVIMSIGLSLFLVPTKENIIALSSPIKEASTIWNRNYLRLFAILILTSAIIWSLFIKPQ